jgi:hypothetical protein
MTASDDEWDWRFTDPAEGEYEKRSDAYKPGDD